MTRQTILTPLKILNKYKRDIESIYQGKQNASQVVVSSIVEIGKICTEARDYKNRLNLKNKNELWEDFEKNLPISKSSVSKYISISEHPTIRLKKFHKQLPPSVYSLYELSKLKDVQLQKFLESGKVNSEIGRTELNLLLSPKSNTKQLTKVVNEIEVLSIRLPSDIWEERFSEIKDKLLEFLNENDIGYSYGKEILNREKQEKKHSQLFEKFILTQLRKIFTKKVRELIESKWKSSSKFIGKKKLTFKQKVKLVGFNWDEVDCSICVDSTEIQNLYLSLDLGTQSEWNILYSDILGRGFEKYPPPNHLTNTDRGVKPPQLEKISSLKKRDFSKFKV